MRPLTLTSAMLLLLAPLPSASLLAEEGDHEFLFEEVESTPQPPDGAEVSSLPPVNFKAAPGSTSGLVGPMTPSATQPIGSLSGRIVYMSCGHGWTYGTSGGGTFWRLQRGTGHVLNEDYGNLDQLNLFAMYCYNAGATVVPFRPIGRQSREVVLDNDSPSVTWVGSWSNSTATDYFYGSVGDVAYRSADISALETATATYTPAIPAAGFYPVYTWVRHGSNRGDQLYRIRHTGGEAQVRIPHHMVGNGWVYLGEFYFNQGANASLGSVVISNLRGSPAGSVVIADAIRFGNGMGSIDRGGGVSTYPREEECTRYWAHAGIGVGMPSSLYDAGSHDESDSWLTPSKMSAEMNFGPRQPPGTTSGLDYKRVHISFHSNAAAGTARGTVGLINGSDPTPNQTALATLCGDEVEADLLGIAPQLEHSWGTRVPTYTGGYSEIDGSYLNYEMDATIIEVAFHDNAQDAELMRDPKARNAVARASYHAVVKYMNQFDTANPVPLTFLPEPPNNPRAVGTTNGIVLTWAAPVNQSGSSSATNYVIYRSTDGYGFGNPVSVGNVVTYTFTNLAVDTDYYFRITAANAGGQSFPAEIVGCRRSSIAGAPKVLVVNAFDRMERNQNLLQPTVARSYVAPGKAGTIERVNPRQNNSFDYIVQHGKAISAYGMAFDSCQNEAIASNQLIMTNYPIAVWACGQESTTNESFSSAEQARVTAFLASERHLFVSGSEIGWDLDRVIGPTAGDRTFMNNQLRADLNGDANDNAGTYTFVPSANSIFTGNAAATFDDGTKGIYWVKAPDVLTPMGPGTRSALTYSGGLGGAAAVEYDGSSGGGRSVYFGFPFEALTTAAAQNAYMADILDFFTPAKILTQPLPQTVERGATVTFEVTTSGHAPISFQWRLDGSNLVGATGSALTRTNVQVTDAGVYTVFVTNKTGTALSSAAILEVTVPRPTIAAAQLLSGQVQFDFTGQQDASYTIEASSDLVIWTVVTNFLLTNGTFQFLHPVTNAQQFYRVETH